MNVESGRVGVACPVELYFPPGMGAGEATLPASILCLSLMPVSVLHYGENIPTASPVSGKDVCFGFAWNPREGNGSQLP